MFSEAMLSCAGCEQPIKERYLDKVLDLTWHTYCVQCADCRSELKDKCFSRDGKLFCRRDFFRRFGPKCAGCGSVILPDEYVRWTRKKPYHMNCLKCSECHKELSTGEELYILDDDRIFCKKDYHFTQASFKQERCDPESPNGSDVSVNTGHCQVQFGPSNHNDSSDELLSAKMLKNNVIKAEMCSPTGNSEPLLENRQRDSVRAQSHKQSSEHKPTRVRTVLNERQLTILRDTYRANNRPDALLKERLVEMTGLSPRVIRVWFQNKRCKDKKRQIMQKQMAQQEKDGRQLQNIASMRGVPLIATSPVQHESPQPLEVQIYHPPWDTMGDYSNLQPDCDPGNPHLPHLVYGIGQGSDDSGFN
ncbi:insulin gene enhancer protein ISL-1-like [Brevipalpus obovatus]|uniref:insulin gene enhancer protein ISL-1-like n=1 Tax=Brevipalpus obovatus TaxID=246614 RepID=UPI003D9E50A5